MHHWRSFPAGLVMMLLIISGCSQPSQFQQTSTTPLPTGTVKAVASTGLRGAVVALLADNRLIAVRPTDGQVLVEQTLGAPPPALVGAGHYLAMSPDGKLLYVLPYAVAGTRSSVVEIATATARVQASYLLPASGMVYRSLAVGAKTGRIYLFGNRGSSVVITVLDAHTGAARISWTARPADGHNWLVYQGAVSSDERQLLVSYHGPDTTGVDVFTWQGQALQRCPSPPFSSVDAGFGCLRSHGGFTFYGAGIPAATGTSLIEELDLHGGLHQAFDTRLVGHLMEFVVDAHRQRLYMIGACGYVNGFSAVDLRKTLYVKP